MRGMSYRALRLVALLETVSFAVLLVGSVLKRTTEFDPVPVLGPIHGVGFVVLVALCFRGVVEERWDWWFPALVVVTGGPVGSLIGDYVLRRKLTEALTA